MGASREMRLACGSCHIFRALHAKTSMNLAASGVLGEAAASVTESIRVASPSGDLRNGPLPCYLPLHFCCRILRFCRLGRPSAPAVDVTLSLPAIAGTAVTINKTRHEAPSFIETSRIMTRNISSARKPYAAVRRDQPDGPPHAVFKHSGVRKRHMTEPKYAVGSDHGNDRSIRPAKTAAVQRDSHFIGPSDLHACWV